MRHQKTGRAVVGKSKMALYNQLKAFHNKKINLRYVMEKAIAGGWAGFYLPEKGGRPNPSPRQDPNAEAERIRQEMAAAAAEREKYAKPPDKPDNGGGYEKMQQTLKKMGVKK